MAEDIKNIPYAKATNIAIPKGADPAKIKAGDAYGSIVNKLHLVKLANNFPASDLKLSQDYRFQPKTFADLVRASSNEGSGAVQYDIDDFLYTKNVGFPINKLITLRRFPYPCTDNIYDKFNQAEPDIARMITYFDQDTNKLEDILSMSFGLKWKEITAEMEQGSSIGPQSGFGGWMANVMKIIDPTLANNVRKGENALNYDPKHDQNKVFGPVDSLTQTHIRDVGLNFEKEFEITFEYEMRSIAGRTGEFAFKDIISNVLAVTYNNAKFWPGSRYWVGDRPSRFIDAFTKLTDGDADQILTKSYNSLKAALSGFNDKGSAIKALKTALTNGLNIALGKILDKVGRPSILVMNSLLSGEPIGNWHLMIGNPDNPIMCIGNLMVMGTDVSFPTDSLGYGDFPTKLQVKVKLKPAMPKDKAGIEMMFNMGKQRIYYNPTSINKNQNPNKIASEARGFFGFSNDDIKRTAKEAFDFASKEVDIITTEVKKDLSKLSASADIKTESTNDGNMGLLTDNAVTFA